MLLAAFLLSAVHLAPFVHGSALADHTPKSSVQLDQAAVVGTVDGAVQSFLGIPFAQPPVGDLRLRLPQLLTSYQGTVNATAFGNQCIQQPLLLPPDVPDQILQDIGQLGPIFAANADVPQSEDCLYINVIRPTNTRADARLPVLVWIYGGAFALGSNAMPAFNGSAVVQRSIDIGEPVIYVAVNYRLNVFGFLGGEEVKEAGVGNLGLHDQRAGLRWVHKFISAFGGDPTKVTIWGESAGAISVALQMLTNGGNTKGLFRAGIMSSGFSVPTGDITEVQGTYDSVVEQVGCSGSSDTLACLRTVSSDDLLKASNNTPNALSYAGVNIPYMPRADGVFVTEPPQKLAVAGKLAKIPFIAGDVIDEATLFTIGSLNVTTDAEFADFLAKVWFPGASLTDLQPVLALYPSDPAAGSPFNTGTANAFSPQFKRMAAVQGDWFFNAPRRQLLEKYASTQTTYTFLSARGNLPGLGYEHGNDLITAYGPGDMTDYFVRFVNHLDPNCATGVQWPKFNVHKRQALQFNDGNPTLEVVPDVARLNGTVALFRLGLKSPI